MKRLNPDKLYVELRKGVTKSEPVIGRKYTLTHSDTTGALFLTIGRQYAFDKLNPMMDEVLGEWRKGGSPFLYIYVYVDGQFDSATSAIRDEIFRRELPLAIEALIYGDRYLYYSHPDLGCSSIWVCFYSTYPDYYRVEHWGYIKDYK